MGKVKDLKGMKFGKLLVLENTGKLSLTNQIIWKCQCDCGNIKEVCTKDFGKNRYGKPRIQSCGCLVDEVRRTRGKWFIKPKENDFLKPLYRITSKKELSGTSLWLCVCKICNQEFKVQRKHITIKHGCPKCMKEKVIRISQSKRGIKSCHWKGSQNIPYSYYTGIKNGAISRKIEFKIQINDLEALWKKQKGICAISQLPLSFSDKVTDRSKTTASLDRIDSSMGYTKDNIQWIHKDINRMKQDLNEDVFINYCKRIASVNS